MYWSQIAIVNCPMLKFVMVPQRRFHKPHTTVKQEKPDLRWRSSLNSQQHLLDHKAGWNREISGFVMNSPKANVQPSRQLGRNCRSINVPPFSDDQNLAGGVRRLDDIGWFQSVER